MTDTPTPSAAETASFDAITAIEAALQPYIESARTGETAGMRSTWLENARIIGHIDGQAIDVGLEEYAALAPSLASPDVKHRITSIQVQGQAASARIEFVGWAGHRFTDFFLLSQQGACGR